MGVEHTKAVWAAARILHEAGCSRSACAHGNLDVDQGDLDLARDVMAGAAPPVAAAERERTGHVTRFEVIDETGRLLTVYGVAVKLSYQDDDRTLKVFLKRRESP